MVLVKSKDHAIILVGIPSYLLKLALMCHKHLPSNLHSMQTIPFVSITCLTISSVAPSNVKIALESSAVLDALILTIYLGG